MIDVVGSGPILSNSCSRSSSVEQLFLTSGDRGVGLSPTKSVWVQIRQFSFSEVEKATTVSLNAQVHSAENV